MQRVLDLDLDFFVQPVVLNVARDAPRPDPEDFEVALDDDTDLRVVNVDSVSGEQAARHYLSERLLLDRPLPGGAVEYHDEVFTLWAQLIADGALRAPFHVTHVDAHGDFGTGQLSHEHIRSDILQRPAHERPSRSRELLNEGDYLLYAVACRWLHAIDYVYCPGGGSDIDLWCWENFDAPSWWGGEACGTVRLAALPKTTMACLCTGQRPSVKYTEPRVRFRGIQQCRYRAAEPFDFVFLSRSPAFTPTTADPLYDAISAAFIVAL